MAVSPVDPVKPPSARPAMAPVLARVFGGEIIASDFAQGPASHAGDGLRLVFFGPTSPAVAIDVECRDAPAPVALMGWLQDLPATAALRYWTVLECLAKLSNQPVLTLLRQIGTQPEPDFFAEAGRISVAGIDAEFVRLDTPCYWIAAARCLPDPTLAVVLRST